MNIKIKQIIFIVCILISYSCSSVNEVKSYNWASGTGRIPSILPDTEIELLALLTPSFNNLISPPSLLEGEEFLIAQIKYPEIARRAGVQGIIIVEFRVDTSGNSNRVKLIIGIGAGCDEVVIEAIKASKFIPAKMNDESVEQKMRASFSFRLHKKE